MSRRKNAKISCYEFLMRKNSRFGSSIPEHAITIDDTCFERHLPLAAHSNWCKILSSRLNVRQRNEKTAAEEITMWFDRLCQCNCIARHFEIVALRRDEL